MSQARISQLQEHISDDLKRGEVMHALVLDNVQQYVRVFKPGIGFENKLQRGTFATVIHLKDVEPGAFDLEPYTSSLIENKQSSMTVCSIN